MTRVALTLCTMLSLSAAAHDLGVDVGAGWTRASADNPRSGSVGVGASGAYDFNDAWSLTGLLLYTRDLATRTGSGTLSPGGNVFLLNLGVMWLPTESVMTMLSATFSPPTQQRNTTTVTTRTGAALDVDVTSRNWTAGAQWNGLWSSQGESNLEHTVELGAGFTRYSVFQQLETGTTLRSQLLENACANGSTLRVCRLINGINSPLLQGKLSGGYTATLFRDTDVGLDAAYYLYDQAPSSVGYFSLVSLGQTEVGNGVPVNPLLVTVRGHVAHRFGAVRVKLSYQYGAYAEGLGALHLATARVTVKLSTHWRMNFTASGQLDVTPDGVANTGAQGLFGMTYVW